MYRKNAGPVVLRNLQTFQKKSWLRSVAKNLPSRAPTDSAKIGAPVTLRPAGKLLERMYHDWRCKRYRTACTPQQQAVLREKLIASQVRSNICNIASHPASAAFQGQKGVVPKLCARTLQGRPDWTQRRTIHLQVVEVRAAHWMWQC